MTKLNELAPREGSTKGRMRVGRGPGSGKGKTAGRGVKGQKARSGVAIAGFEGGQMPLHMRMPKRGFNSLNRKDFAEVNLWRLEQAVAAGKLDVASNAIDSAALVASGVLRRVKDGVKLLGKGELKAKLNLTVYRPPPRRAPRWRRPAARSPRPSPLRKPKLKPRPLSLPDHGGGEGAGDRGRVVSLSVTDSKSWGIEWPRPPNSSQPT
jgi:large subunit ribosomal protein L15